jgi:hypothetical protein
VSVIADLDADGSAGPGDSVNLRCSPEEATRRLRRLAELGFDEVVVMSANPGAGHLDALAELFRG